MELKDKLSSLRRESKLTQTELAEKLKVSRQTVSNWEMGEVLPSTDNLGRLSELYGVSMDYLINGDAQPPKAAVAVMEKPEPERLRRKPALMGAVIGLIISLVIALMVGAFFTGYDKGVKDATPTYPVHTDILDENNFEGTVDVKPLSTPPANTLDEGASEGTFDITAK